MEELFVIVMGALIFSLIFWGLKDGYLQVKGHTKMTTLIDDIAITRLHEEKILEQVRWDELSKVEIHTTDEGPFVEDVFFVLHGAQNRGCVIGQSEAYGTELLSRLQELPGFHNEQVIAAMGCSENARFLCWEREVGRI